MNAWKKTSGADGKIELLADGSATFAKAIGLDGRISARAASARARSATAMVVEDGVVKTLNIEDAPGKADISGAENLLKGM